MTRSAGRHAGPVTEPARDAQPAKEHGTGVRGLLSRIRPAAVTAKGAVLTAGALAAAVAAVVAVLPHDEPVLVDITGVEVNPALLPLADFRPSAGRSLALGPAGGPSAVVAAADGTPVTLRLAAGADVLATPGAETVGPSPSGLPVAPTQDSTAPTAPTEPPTSAQTGTSTPTGTTESPTGTTEPATPTSPATPATTSPPPTPTGFASERVRPQLPRRYTSAVTDLVNQKFVVAGSRDPLPPNAPTVVFFSSQALNAAGDPVAPEVAARRIVKVLSHVRSVPASGSGSGHSGGKGGAGHEKAREPVGVVAKVNLDLEHAVGETVRIYWELRDARSGVVQRLTRDWLRDYPAYEVVGEQDPDRGVISVWIPVPEKPGDYVVSFSAWAGGNSDAPQDAQAAETHIR